MRGRMDKSRLEVQDYVAKATILFLGMLGAVNLFTQVEPLQAGTWKPGPRDLPLRSVSQCPAGGSIESELRLLQPSRARKHGKGKSSKKH